MKKYILIIVLLVSCTDNLEIQEEIHEESMKFYINSLQGEVREKDFRSAAFNIWEGGKSTAGRILIQKMIERMGADVLSIQEAGTVSVIKPYLEAAGYSHFYGTGGTYELYCASKIPYEYTHTFVENTEWQGHRNPLYTEVLIGGKLIGIVNVHLDSSCSGVCHHEDYLNVPPFEPSAYTRNVQLNWIMKYMNERKITQPLLKGFLIQGDYNLIYNEANVTQYVAVPGGGPSLPAFLSWPLMNKQVPNKQFEAYDGLITLDTSNAIDGKDYTLWGDPYTLNPLVTFEHRIDYIAFTDDLILLGAEVLNSISDSENVGGLEKYNDQLDSDDGYNASDHLPVFADFKIN